LYFINTIGIAVACAIYFLEKSKFNAFNSLQFPLGFSGVDGYSQPEPGRDGSGATVTVTATVTPGAAHRHALLPRASPTDRRPARPKYN
jgi:hypothetical protein